MEPERGFRFAYDPPTIRFGQGCTSDLRSELHILGYDQALVVTGETTGSTPEVMRPIRQGLDDRLAGVFTETTAKKRLQTAVRCADKLAETDADVLVAVGGGSSLDIARVASVVAARASSPETLGTQLAATGTLSVPDDITPVVAVPTTLAGAELSMLAGVSASPSSGLVSEPTGGGIGSQKLIAPLALYDPELLATTPVDILAGSVVNGFNKGIEALYASTRTPVTDGTASRGIKLLAASLPALHPDPSAEDVGRLARGVMLASYGTTRLSGTSFSVLHAIGHALRIHADVQLGVAHAAVTPDTLAWLFESVDGRRQLLGDALGVVAANDSDTELAAKIVTAIQTLFTDIGLPDQLRMVEGVDRADLDDIAATAANSFLGANDAPDQKRAPREARETAHAWSGTPHTPPGLSVSQADVQAVLEAAW